MTSKIKNVGTVLPMTALISKTAETGTFRAGRKFITWLAKSKQNAWQFLPLHETQLEPGSATQHQPSPYKGYGIGLDPRYLSSDSPEASDEQLAQFVLENDYWLGNYALFCALRAHFGTDNWSLWPTEIRARNPDSLKKWREKLSPKIQLQTNTQCQLHLDYHKLRTKAHESNISLIGDMPFYLGLNSPLVWQYQHLFEIELDGNLKRVSGVPLGPKSHFGRQVWGHPLYRWQEPNLLPELSSLFKFRLQYLASQLDWVRLDHAKALFSYGAINLVDNTDQYLTGPGTKFIEELIDFTRENDLKLYAEDTGDKLRKLSSCLRSNHIPGIKIFRFAYNEKSKKFSNKYLDISQYPANTFAHTTTHDTETLMGYLQLLSSYEIKVLATRLDLQPTTDLSSLAESIRDKIIDSPSIMTLIPLQDWLLTTDRINIPGTEKSINDTNWQYQMSVAIEDLPANLI